MLRSAGYSLTEYSFIIRYISDTKNKIKIL